jgi:hypothetical protein
MTGAGRGTSAAAACSGTVIGAITSRVMSKSLHVCTCGHG